MITTMASRSDVSALKFYSATLMGILGHPRKFFGDLPESVGMAQAAGFLTVSAIVHSIAALVYTAPANSLVMGGTLLANAIGMVFPADGVGLCGSPRQRQKQGAIRRIVPHLCPFYRRDPAGLLGAGTCGLY